MSGEPALTRPLSHAQRLLWTGQALLPDRPMYNMALAFDIEGPLDVDRFRQAFASVVARSATLRTVFVPTEPGANSAADGSLGSEVNQVVRATLPHDVPVIDLRSAADTAAAADAWVQHRARQPFALDRCGFDSALLQLDAERWRWFFNQHHIIADAWSTAIVFRQVQHAYLNEGTLEPAIPSAVEAVPARAPATKPRSDADDEAAARASTSELQLYGCSVRELGTESQRIGFELSAEQRRGLQRLLAVPQVRALSADLARMQVLCTAIFAFVHKVSGAQSISIALPIHNRTTPRDRETIGLFMELFAVTVDIDDGETFRSLHAKTRTAVQNTFRQAVGGSSEVRELRALNVVLNYVQARFTDFAGMPVTTHWVHPGHSDPQHALRFQVHDFSGRGDWGIEVDVNERIGRHEPGRVVQHFGSVFDAMVEDFDQSLDQVVLRATGANIQHPGRPGRRVERKHAATVLTRFDEIVAAHPNDAAVVEGERQISYSDLRRHALAVAASLRAQGVAPGDKVALLLPRGADTVISLLGVLYAGCAYVPIDPQTPKLRLAYMLEDAAPTAIIVRRGQHDALPSDNRPAIVIFEDIDPSTDGRFAPFPLEGSSLAYVLYTSGSTGRPKGVLVEHRGLTEYAQWAAESYTHDRRPVFAFHSPVTFDLTVTSIFVPLITGGRIVVFPETSRTADVSVLDALRDETIDLIKLTPSHLALALDDWRSSTVPRRRHGLTMILGGEALETKLARRAHEALDGQVAIYNEYGPTEAVVGCMIHCFDYEEDQGVGVPIGVAADNTELYVLDGGLNPVPPGVPGELCVARIGLARGYLNRPEETEARFVANPFVANPFVPGDRMYRTGDLVMTREDGVVEYLGRIDRQVKLRGFRIEPAEIEGTLVDHPAIDRAVVHVLTETPSDDTINVVRCARCGIPDSYPEARIESDGICAVCNAFDRYRDRVASYFRTESELQAILRQAQHERTGSYDVLLLLSGGKDSSYALLRLVEMGARVLTATLDNGYISESAIENIKRVTRELGVDHVFMTTPRMADIFKDSLERHFNVCHGCFKTIYTLGTQLAQDHGIPVLVTGLSRGQMFETRLSPALFEGQTVDSTAIDRMVLDARKAYHRAKDGTNRLLDTRIFDDETVFDRVRFVDFYRYCDVSLDEMMTALTTRLPWIRPRDTGRSTNCLINDAGIFVHKRKTGFHNYALPYSWDVRLGHKTRDAAIDELNDDIDSAKVFRILDEIGYADEELTTDPNTPRLAAYYVARSAVDERDLRDWMQARLPPALFPRYLIPIDQVPLTRNGKVDHSALPLPSSRRRRAAGDYAPPRGPREELLATLWSTALRLAAVGRTDNFFDLGGDSVTALQIVARAADSGLAFTAADLFEHQTVARLATVARFLEVTDDALPAAKPGAGLAALGDKKKTQLLAALSKRKNR